MKIASSSVTLQSSHIESSRLEVSESLEVWIGERRPGRRRPEEVAAMDRPPATRVSLSDQALAAHRASSAEDADEEAELDPRMRLLRNLIELLTGRPIRVLDLSEMRQPDADATTMPPVEGAPSESNGNPRRSAGFGIDYQFHAHYEEHEAVSFHAAGTVRTADGREIAFDLAARMERSYSESVSVEFRAGDARLKDPLVLDFAGPAAALQDLRFEFDLDADGQVDQVPLLGGGRGFLAFDRNGNGRIDDGNELFGPTSGDGFAELAALDGDGNGWIDENDAAFEHLRVWQPDGEGAGSTQSLIDAGVGALYLGHVATPFSLRNAANDTLGAIRASSIYLAEDGSTGTVSQIDLSV